MEYFSYYQLVLTQNHMNCIPHERYNSYKKRIIVSKEIKEERERDMELISCMLFLFLSLSLLLLFNSKRSSSRQWKNKRPPGPKGYPLIGNLLEMGDKPHQSLAILAASHGPIMRLKLGQMTTIVISSAAMAKQVLQTHDQALSDRTVPHSSTVYDHDKLGFPWLPVSDLWRTLRKVCNNHMFSHNALDSHEPIRRNNVGRLLADIRRSAHNGESVDIERAVFGAAFNMLSNTIFSVDLADPNSEWAKEFKETVWGILEESGKFDVGDYFPVLKWMDLRGSRRRMMVYIKKFLDMIGEMIEERFRRQEFAGGFDGGHRDMFHNLLNLAKENTYPNFDVYLIKHLILVNLSCFP